MKTGLLLFTTLVLLGCAHDNRVVMDTGLLISPRQSYSVEKIRDGLYDTTKDWQERFGLDGRLAIREGRIHTRLPAADHPVELSFQAIPADPGWYTFVFVLVDRFEKPNQVVLVHLLVYEGVINPTPLVITPLRPQGRFNHRVSPEEQFVVQWHDYDAVAPLGGGWRLTDVIYTDCTANRDKPGFPGFDDRGVK